MTELAQNTYNAIVRRLGTPAQWIADLLADPEATVTSVRDFLEDGEALAATLPECAESEDADLACQEYVEQAYALL